MASLCQRPALTGARGQAAAARPQRARVQICGSFKNKENVDLSKVANYARHANDAGSTEVQIARLSARVQQISSHLKENRKDSSSKRGLEAVLAQRKSLMQYLYRTNRASYDRLVVELGIRSVVAGDSHKAAQRAAAAAEGAAH
ncbi:rps15 [Scenedesmus sp. PABB004]|nr:rps15 [Scenedesmus sp. PABB004]